MVLNGNFNGNAKWDSIEAQGTESYWDNMLLKLTQRF